MIENFLGKNSCDSVCKYYEVITVRYILNDEYSLSVS